MYNSIYPMNINFTKRNPYLKNKDENSAAQGTNQNAQKENTNTFPNGARVNIDYSKGQINISQVLADFKNTIIAINAPDEVKDEVSLYLGLVEKESKKENPSKDIVVSNLINASRISDNYIAATLKKPSNVVENWISTLLEQKINIKANPDEINPDFQLQFPKKAQEKIDEENSKAEVFIPEEKVETIAPKTEIKIINNNEKIETQSEIELSQDDEESAPETVSYAPPQKQTAFTPNNTHDMKARELYILAKNTPATNKGDIDAINYLNEALGEIADDESANENIRAALHIERGKIFDRYDYVSKALRDYFEATKAADYNLKAQAHYHSGKIYDEFNEFNPALDNYLASVAYSGEADNLNAQSKVLSKIAGLYASQFDLERTKDYSMMALDAAYDTNDEKLIADTYSKSAQNYQYLGDNEAALDSYKNALYSFSRNDESYEQMAYNYEQASVVMEKLGNKAKAAKLLLKANQYYQKAQQMQGQLEEAS